MKSDKLHIFWIGQIKLLKKHVKINKLTKYNGYCIH